MSHAIPLSIPHPDLRSRINRLFSTLMQLAALDPTRQALRRISEMSDADVAASGQSRAELVRRILGPRATF